MGFYDCRCMATGVSLKGADASLVLLQQEGAGYQPIGLAVKGNYNRLGSVDGIKQDANTELLLRYFLDKLNQGRFVVDAAYFRSHGCYPITNIEQLLAGFERNINEGNYAMLDGRPVVFALISRAVWDGIANDGRPARESPTALFQSLFKDVAIAAEIYGGSLASVWVHLQEQAAVSAFLADLGLDWKQADAGGQDYPEEMRQYLQEARLAFSNCAVVLKALNDYEREVSDLLGDE
jgi:hypothetical protein